VEIKQNNIWRIKMDHARFIDLLMTLGDDETIGISDGATTYNGYGLIDLINQGEDSRTLLDRPYIYTHERIYVYEDVNSEGEIESYDIKRGHFSETDPNDFIEDEE
jgi:hypothetical protein